VTYETPGGRISRESDVPAESPPNPEPEPLPPEGTSHSLWWQKVRIPTSLTGWSRRPTFRSPPNTEPWPVEPDAGEPRGETFQAE
jgi:hypothetical protein